MLIGRSEVLAGNKVPADNENQATKSKTNNIHPETLEFTQVNFNYLIDELVRAKQELTYYKAQKKYYLDQANHYQEQVLEMQEKILTYHGIENKPYMKVAQ